MSKKKIIIGVDPGKTGAISFMTTKFKKLVVVDMPIINKPFGKGEMVDPRKLKEIVTTNTKGKEIDSIFIEQVFAMFRSSGASALDLGISYGITIRVLTELGRPIYFIHPRTWKTALKLVGKTKKASIQLALKLVPISKKYLVYAKDVDRAEAILIAYYGYKNKAQFNLLHQRNKK